MKRVAVVDLGSNTAILLIMENQAPLRVVHEEFRIPRLAEGLKRGGDFMPAALQRAIASLQEFVEIAGEYDAKIVCCGGTAPFRKVRNPQGAIEAIAAATGVRVEILSERDEAWCAYASALQLPMRGQAPRVSGKAAVLDIGGGSCEICCGEATEIRAFSSTPSGCVDVTESCLQSQLREDGLATSAELDAAKEKMHDFFPELPEASGSKFFAVAGTPVTLALLEKEIRQYDPAAVDGTTLSLERVSFWKQQMSQTQLRDKVQRYGIPKGRAELQLSGLIILEACMQHYGFSDVTVRNAGLRYGLALRTLQR